MRDPLDELGARLFEAAREEPLPAGAAERTLAAARREIGAGPRRVRGRPNALKWSIGVGVVALAAGIALYAQHEEPVARISAEPETGVLRKHANRAPATPSEAPTTALSAVPSALTSASSVPSSAPAPARSAAPVSLTDELNSLKVAQNALGAGDARAALAALDEYDHVLKGKVLRAEATLLRIEALARAEQAGAASTLAQRFVAQNPGSPLVDRARSFVLPEQ